MMISPPDLMRAHLAALFTMDGPGRLLSVNEPGGGPAPRFFLGRTEEGHVWAVRHDVGPAVVAELALVLESEPDGTEGEDPECADIVAELLSRHDPIHRRWSGPAYCCSDSDRGRLGQGIGRLRHSPATPGERREGRTVTVTPEDVHLFRRYFESWIPDVRAGAPMVARVEDGHAVSLCCSVRVTETAHEAGVETHPDFRGRGHASCAVAGWAEVVRSLECVPLYSTSWDNDASRAVARKLGLIRFGADFHLT